MKTHIHYTSLLIVFVIFCGCFDQNATLGTSSKQQGAEIRDIEVSEAARLISEDGSLVILDVRTPSEFSQGHIKGAVNIDYKAVDFETKLAALDKHVTYIMHCQSGGRSRRSLSTIRKLGFEKVLHMNAGFAGWKNSGQPIAQ